MSTAESRERARKLLDVRILIMALARDLEPVPDRDLAQARKLTLALDQSRSRGLVSNFDSVLALASDLASDLDLARFRPANSIAPAPLISAATTTSPAPLSPPSLA